MAKTQLLKGDSLKLIKNLPDNSVDLILTDPPYNLAQYSTGNIAASWRKAINNDIADWDKHPLNPVELVEDFKRVLKPAGNAFIFTSYNLIGEWHKAFDSEFDTFQFAVWHKTNPTPKFYKNGFLNSCELIVCLWNKGHFWNFSTQKEMHNFFESPICMGNERIKDPKHPTQKPIKVLKNFAQIACPEGGTVLDPFMGVGSTGEACAELGFNFIGMETDEQYFKACETRLL